jgi:hypothetical protein
MSLLRYARNDKNRTLILAKLALVTSRGILPLTKEEIASSKTPRNDERRRQVCQPDLIRLD